MAKNRKKIEMLRPPSSYVDPPPPKGGGRHIVLQMSASASASSSASASASHQLLREPLLKFFWQACFFPRALAFDFCYDLDLCSQGQAVRAFFIRMGFSLILSKLQGGF